MFYPKLYDAIRHDSEPVLRTHSADKVNDDAGKFIEAHTEGMTPAEKRAAASLVQALFPRMGPAIIGSDWESEFAHDQRIASSYSFPRYFTYGVSSSDVPDVALKSFIAALTQVSADESAKAFRGLINDCNAGTLLYELRSQEDQLPAESAASCHRLLGEPREGTGLEPAMCDIVASRKRELSCGHLAPSLAGGGKIRVRVHQLVKSLQGDVLSDSEVLHVFTMKSGLIADMDLGDEADPTAGPSPAFAHRS
jgi:hypothetical protein